MELQIIASSSKGNCYLLKGENGGSLLLEAGLPFKNIKQRLGYDMSNIQACLVTHEHQDHAKAILDVGKAGIDVYASNGTLEASGASGHRFHSVGDKTQFEIDGFMILAFSVEHDAREPLGFLIQEKTSGDKLLFVTDTYYVRYKFSGLTHIAVECNYSEHILAENVAHGIVPVSLARRIRKSHFSLENVIDFLKANDLSSLKKLYLLHLSDGNSDEKLFENEIRKVYKGDLLIGESGGVVCKTNADFARPTASR